MALELASFSALTFDCYGTLIDWETGIKTALRPMLDAHGVALSDSDLLAAYAEFEAKTEKAAYLPYRDVLRIVVQQFGKRYGFTPSPEECDSLPDSLPNWLPFPDTVPSLQILARRYSLNIISNTDDALFAETAKHLKVPFAQVITAEQVGSYKPSHRNFEEALRRLNLPREKVLHVAESLHHDIVPALALGIANVWVNRRMGKAGASATLPASATPDLIVPDLKTLAEMTERI